jgi:hypothetical protein
MDEKKAKIAKQLIGQAREFGEDFHGEQYWDLLHERQQLLLKMMVIVVDEMLPKDTTMKEKKVG